MVARATRSCSSSPKRMPGPTKRRPLARGRAPTSAAISVDFPEPFGPRSRGGRRVEARGRSARAGSRPARRPPLQPGDDLAASLRSERELEAPGRPRLLHLLEPLEPLCAAHLGHQRVGPRRSAIFPAVRASPWRLRSSPRTAHAHRRSVRMAPSSPSCRPRGAARTRTSRRRTRGFASSRPRTRRPARPSARETPGRGRRGRARSASRPRSAPTARGRRNRGRSSARRGGARRSARAGSRPAWRARLASRESPERPVEPVEPDPGRSRAGVEVVGAERQEALEGIGMLLHGLGLVGEGAASASSWSRRHRRPCAARGIRAAFRQAARRPPGRDADRQRRRTALERALVGLVKPGEQAQERRLPLPLGPTTPIRAPGRTSSDAPSRIVSAP